GTTYTLLSTTIGVLVIVLAIPLGPKTATLRRLGPLHPLSGDWEASTPGRKRSNFLFPRKFLPANGPLITPIGRIFVVPFRLDERGRPGASRMVELPSALIVSHRGTAGRFPTGG